MASQPSQGWVHAACMDQPRGFHADRVLGGEQGLCVAGPWGLCPPQGARAVRPAGTAGLRSPGWLLCSWSLNLPSPAHVSAAQLARTHPMGADLHPQECTAVHWSGQRGRGELWRQENRPEWAPTLPALWGQAWLVSVGCQSPCAQWGNLCAQVEAVLGCPH